MKVFFLVLVVLAACSCDKPQPKGPGNSTVPCAENCGSDPNCNSKCAPVGTQSPGVPPIR